MYLLAKLGGHRSYGSEDINPYIIYHTNISEKTEVSASIRLTEKFLKSKIPINNSTFVENWLRKRKRRRTKVIIKCCAVQANTIKLYRK